MFVITSGCVKAFRTTEQGVDVVVGVLGKGECFGEISAFDNLPRMVSLTAVSDTETIEIGADALLETVMASPGFACELLKVMSGKLRHQFSAYESLATKDVSARVAELLLRLSYKHGEPYTNGHKPGNSAAIIIALSLTLNDIATCVGATRERVSRVVADIKRNEIITTCEDTKRIVVIDHEKLRQIAEAG